MARHASRALVLAVCALSTVAGEEADGSGQCDADSEGKCAKKARSTPLYHHGMRPPIDLPCLTEEESARVFEKVLELRQFWDIRRPGAEATVGSIPGFMRKMKELGLYYFTLGGIHNYDSHSEVRAKTEGEIGQSMQEAFSWVFERVRSCLEPLLQEPVELYGRDSHLSFRIQSSEVLTSNEAVQFASTFNSPPHWDGIYDNLPWQEGTQFNHSISFTLPVRLPRAGSGLKIYHAYHDMWNSEWRDYENRVIDALTIREGYQLEHHIHEYQVGVIAFHSGMELHAIPELRVEPGQDLINSKEPEFRVTLQGWGVWNDGVWTIFS